MFCFIYNLAMTTCHSKDSFTKQCSKIVMFTCGKKEAKRKKKEKKKEKRKRKKKGAGWGGVG